MKPLEERVEGNSMVHVARRVIGSKRVKLYSIRKADTKSAQACLTTYKHTFIWRLVKHPLSRGLRSFR